MTTDINKECSCSYRMLRRVETRINNPRCPKHGKSGHLQSIPKNNNHKAESTEKINSIPPQLNLVKKE